MRIFRIHKNRTNHEVIKFLFTPCNHLIHSFIIGNFVFLLKKHEQTRKQSLITKHMSSTNLQVSIDVQDISVKRRKRSKISETSSCSSCSRMACRKARRSWLDDFWSNIPAWMTFWSTLSLYLAAARIFSSTLFTVHKRSTRTSFCCPIRWARSWACRSYKEEWQRKSEEFYSFILKNNVFIREPFINNTNTVCSIQVPRPRVVFCYFTDAMAQRSGHCVTWWGFQSLSKMTTVSALCRFSPRPPALVLRRKMKYWDSGSLNIFRSMPRSSALVVPT